jgi:hypothetical protein
VRNSAHGSWWSEGPLAPKAARGVSQAIERLADYTVGTSIVLLHLFLLRVGRPGGLVPIAARAESHGDVSGMAPNG